MAANIALRPRRIIERLSWAVVVLCFVRFGFVWASVGVINLFWEAKTHLFLEQNLNPTVVFKNLQIITETNSYVENIL